MKIPSDQNISPLKIIDLVIAVVAGGGSYSDEQLREFAGFKNTSNYFDNCVEWANELGFVKRKGERLSSIKASTRGIYDGMEETEKKRAFASALLKWKPFMFFLANIERNISIKDSSTRIRAHFGFENSASLLGTLFTKWGIQTDLLHKDRGRNSYRLSDSVQAAKIEQRKAANIPLESEAACRLRIESILGADAFGYLEEDEIGDFVEALREYEKNPKDAVHKTSLAVEDFLRRMALDLGLTEATKKNGPGELANLLYNHRDVSGNHMPLIHDKHRKVVDAVAAVRVMAAHGKDRAAPERWNVSRESALGHVYFSLGLIRSIYAFVKQGGRYEF